MPALRRQITLANRAGVIFALNTPRRKIRYLQTRILTGIQAIDQFILNYSTHLININRERTHTLILRFKHQANEIQLHINDGIGLCTAADNNLQYYKPIFGDYHNTLDPMVFLLNSYTDSITIKETGNALNKLDGVKTPSPPPTAKPLETSHDDDEFEFYFTSSSEDDFTSDDE
jgi:hypothetical protein